MSSSTFTVGVFIIVVVYCTSKCVFVSHEFVFNGNLVYCCCSYCRSVVLPGLVVKNKATKKKPNCTNIDCILWKRLVLKYHFFAPYLIKSFSY